MGNETLSYYKKRSREISTHPLCEILTVTRGSTCAEQTADPPPSTLLSMRLTERTHPPVLTEETKLQSRPASLTRTTTSPAPSRPS